MHSSWRVTIVTAIVVALSAGAAVTAWRVSSDADRADAASDRERREEDRDAVRSDGARSETFLAEQKRSLGQSAVPVRDAEVVAPKGVTESILTGDLIIGDFTDVFVDEGIVLSGISAKEVDEIAMRDLDTVPPRKRPPFKPDKGLRLVQVDLRVLNRSGDGADPACGMAAAFNGYAFDDKGKQALILNESYATTATYPGSCGIGIADGETGRIRLGVGLKQGDKLAALQFAFLGEGKPDGASQVLVFDKPV